MTIFLETKRLIIKPPTRDQIEKIYVLDSDPDVMRYIGNGKPRSTSDSEEWYEKSVKHFEKYGFSFGLVYEKESGEFIGRAGINYNAYDDTESDIEIGYRLHKKFWNKGYATELAEALIKWGFENLKVDRLCACAHPDNQASRHVLEKVGMRFVGLSQYVDEEVVSYEIFNKANSIYNILAQNILKTFGKNGKEWLSKLSTTVLALVNHWQLNSIIPVNNMSFHFVAKAITLTRKPVVVKIGCDKKVIQAEMQALKYFSDGSIQLIDYYPEYNALLLQQAMPGISLKSIYPEQVEFVMDCYIETMKKLHNQILPKKNNFIHIREWLQAIDHVSSDRIPDKLLTKGIFLKNKLLNTLDKEIFLHGDLHHDNIIKDGENWVAIDPKGIVGEPAFEIAAFDFIHPSELEREDIREIFEERLNLISQKSGIFLQKIKDWVFVRLILSAAWSIEDKGDPSWTISLAEILQ